MNTADTTAGLLAVALLCLASMPQQAQAQEDDEQTDPVSVDAQGVPYALTHQGRLADDGEPMTGQVELTYTIYDDPSEGSVLWQDVLQVELDDTGFYSVELGGPDNPIDPTVLQDGQGWLGVAVGDDEEMKPRISLNSVPYAVVAEESVRAAESEYADEAQTALEVEPGAITSEALAEDFSLDSEHVEEATGQTLGKMSCVDGDVARFDGSEWSCDDTVGRAEVATLAEDVADGAITTDALADDFTLDPENIDDGAEQTIGKMSCADGDIARFDGSEWSCDDTVGRAEVATLAEDIADGAIDPDSLADGFTIQSDQIEGTTLSGMTCTDGQVAGYDSSSGNWICKDAAAGSVTHVAGVSPINTTDGSTPAISITEADGSTDGYLTSDDYSDFDNRLRALSVEADSPLTRSGDSLEPVLGMTASNDSTAGYLTPDDYSDFDNRLENVSVQGGALYKSSGGTTPAISLDEASDSISGYLSSDDYSNFNQRIDAKVEEITATSPVNTSMPSSGSYNIGLSEAGPTQDGYLTSGDYTDFDNRLENVSVQGGALYKSSDGTTPTISLDEADDSISGYLSSDDYSNFNQRIDAKVEEITATSPVNTSMPSSGAYHITMAEADGTTDGYLSSDKYTDFNQRLAEVRGGTGINVDDSSITSPEIELDNTATSTEAATGVRVVDTSQTTNFTESFDVGFEPSKVSITAQIHHGSSKNGQVYSGQNNGSSNDFGQSEGTVTRNGDMSVNAFSTGSNSIDGHWTYIGDDRVVQLVHNNGDGDSNYGETTATATTTSNGFDLTFTSAHDDANVAIQYDAIR